MADAARSGPFEERMALVREMGESYRDFFRVAWEELTAGWAPAMRRRLLRFFTTETTPAYWLTLAEADDDRRAGITEALLSGQAPPELQQAYHLGQDGILHERDPLSGALVPYRGEAERQLAQWSALQPQEAA